MTRATRSRMWRFATAGGITLCWIIGSAATGLGGDAAREAAADQKPDKKKERLSKPWPDARKLKKREQAAESLPLFATDENLSFTLAADFKALNRDRTVDSTKRFPGVLTVAGSDGQPVEIPVQLNTRGNRRLNRKVCTFVPLKIRFSKQEAKGTPFEDQGSLKLVTHCRKSKEYEQYVLGEALAYRIANLLTPASFRIRLARATYVDSSKGKEIATKWTIFLEDVDDVARRMQGRVAPIKKRLFHHLDQPSLLRLAVFQVMIGNTDYSISGLHNVRLVQDPEGVLRPLAYDFDSSGLVHTRYAAPHQKMKLLSVRDRLYRGPCLPLERLEPTLAELRARKGDILALYDAEPGLTKKHRKKARDYLTDFFDIIDDPKRTKSLFVNRCRPAPGM